MRTRELVKELQKQLAANSPQLPAGKETPEAQASQLAVFMKGQVTGRSEAASGVRVPDETSSSHKQSSAVPLQLESRAHSGLRGPSPKYLTDTTGRVRRRNSTLASNDFGSDMAGNLAKATSKNDQTNQTDYAGIATRQKDLLSTKNSFSERKERILR